LLQKGIVKTQLRPFLFFRSLLALWLALAPLATSASEEALPHLPSKDFLPAAEYTTQYSDPTYGPVTTTITYTVSHNKSEHLAAEAMLKNKLKGAAADGATASMTEIVVDETSDPELSVSTANEPVQTPKWPTKPENTHVVKIFLKKWREFKSYFSDEVTKLQDKVEKIERNRFFKEKDKADARAKLKMARHTETNYDRLLKYLSETEVRSPFSWKKKYIPLYTATFALIRTVTVSGVVYLGFKLNRELNAPDLAIILSSIALGLGSGAIQWNSTPFLAWMNHFGKASKYALRAPVKFMARLLGKSEEAVDAIDKKFSASAMHYTLNAGTKYIATEQPFLALPIIIMALFGVTMYPNAADWLSVLQPIISDINAFTYVAGSYLYVQTMVLYSSVQAYFAQGIWDTSTALVRSHQLRETIDKAKEKEITIDEAVRNKRRIETSAGLKLLGVALGSNLGVILALPDSEASKAIGLTIVGGFGVSGMGYYTYASMKYDPKFQTKLQSFVDNYVIGSDYKSRIGCTELLSNNNWAM